MKQLPPVSIIVVTHNSGKYISRCLKSILNLNYPRYEVIVVDCDSQDGTLNLLEKFKKKITIIESKNNLGFAAANNLAFTQANGKYIFLLNPDTEVDPKALRPLVETLEADSKIAAAQPSVFLYSKRKTLNLTGKEVHFLGFDWIRDFNRTKLPPAGEIYSISGAAVLLQASTLKRIGLFEPEYFMYYEDSDLSWRIRLSGHTMRYVPNAVVFHDYKYLLSNKKATQNKITYYERNRQITLLKNFENRTLLCILPALALSNLGLMVIALIQGWLPAKLKADLMVLANASFIMQGRRHIRSIRKLKDVELAGGFVSRLSFTYFDHPLVRYIANPLFEAYWNLVKPLL